MYNPEIELMAEKRMMSFKWADIFLMAVCGLIPPVIVERAMYSWLGLGLISAPVILFFAGTCLQGFPKVISEAGFKSSVFTTFLWVGRGILIAFVILIAGLADSMTGVLFWVWLFIAPCLFGAPVLYLLWYIRRKLVIRLFPTIGTVFPLY